MEGKPRNVRKLVMGFGPKDLLWIVCVGALIRLFVFLLLPNSPSLFAPDEGTYSSLADWVEQEKPVIDFPAYGADLYNSAKSLLLPSALLIRLGLSPIDSVRFVSLLYGVLSIYVFGKLLYVFSNFGKTSSKGMFRVFVLLFAFFPSNFLWSILGLRESASAFWILSSVYLLTLIKLDRDSSNQGLTSPTVLLKMVMAAISISLAFGARSQTALVFVCFFCTVFIVFMGSNRVAITIICIGGFLGGHLFTLNTADVLPDSPAASPNVEESPAASPNILDEALRQSRLSEINSLEYKRTVNSLDAQTALPISSCLEVTESLVSRVQCNLKELPFRLFSVLLRPMLLLDLGSAKNNLASVENLAWFGMLCALSFAVWPLLREKRSRFIVIPTLTYIISFSCLFALYEGNLGTAFRHKSTILWPILLMLFIYLKIRRFGYSSKEIENE